ncbi:NUDIX hydrolase [Nocardia camponoti]|uniref:Nudix hydrolase domain-containing protein n=1 Tax=Nocardia camponoti TaxID=1616106 RepID=A0A917QSG0_9NOCA|nr:NUDIX domain-containing protein [Nocardia camponoti]GGK65110.1 hypothetical protein GCM10011591_41720 [Nocardia camponoti]
MTNVLRVAAYAVCIRGAGENEEILLARWVSPEGNKHWTLPGGGMEHGEDPVATTKREVDEETGYAVELTALLGIDTDTSRFPRPHGEFAEIHSVRIIYAGTIIGGTLRSETDGSSDLAAWHPISEVAHLVHVRLIDAAIELWRTRPALGRVDS